MSNQNAALDLATVIALTLVSVSILKGLIEVWVNPQARLHDPLIQLVALLVGVAWSFVLLWANGGLGRSAAVQAITSVILGLAGGAGSVGAYHISSALSSPSGATSAAQAALSANGTPGTGPSVVFGAGRAAPGSAEPLQAEAPDAPS